MGVKWNLTVVWICVSLMATPREILIPQIHCISFYVQSPLKRLHTIVISKFFSSPPPRANFSLLRGNIAPIMNACLSPVSYMSKFKVKEVRELHPFGGKNCKGTGGVPREEIWDKSIWGERPFKFGLMRTAGLPLGSSVAVLGPRSSRTEQYLGVLTSG